MQHVLSWLQLLLHPGDKPDWTGADCSLVCPAGPASSPPAAGSAKDALLPSPSPPALPISSLGPGVDPMSFSRAFWQTQLVFCVSLPTPHPPAHSGVSDSQPSRSSLPGSLGVGKEGPHLRPPLILRAQPHGSLRIWPPSVLPHIRKQSDCPESPMQAV